MSKADWGLAPEGATHWVGGSWPWHKHDGNVAYYFGLGGHWKRLVCADVERVEKEYAHSIEERQKQPQAWSGPEDGLPPVGTVCEARILLPGQSNYLWRRCEVVYRNDEMSQSELLVVDIEKTTARWADEFRAIKTEEDIARDKRESAIRELMDIAQVDCRVTAARLVDAGFKREGV